MGEVTHREVLHPQGEQQDAGNAFAAQACSMAPLHGDSNHGGCLRCAIMEASVCTLPSARATRTLMQRLDRHDMQGIKTSQGQLVYGTCLSEVPHLRCS